jgi:exosortase
MTSTHTNRSVNLVRVWLPIAIFGILWADLVRQLSYEWEAREQYAYGWFVPFFAAALLWQRWLDRPASNGLRPPILMTGVVIVAGLALLPIRVIYEINPDWPLVSWLYTLIVVGGTLYAFFLAGGSSWTRHFVFPVAFILVAVVWPWRIENSLTQGLMQIVAGLTVELLGWLNIPALNRGNLIELSTGVVGVDEACSGIRSFQSTLMAALLIGELYRFRLWARLGLVGCGLGLAFTFNVVRTLLLSWQASQHGLAIIDKWHDPAGLTIAVACFLGLWAVAVLLKSRWRVPSAIGSLTSNLQPPTPVAPDSPAVGGSAVPVSSTLPVQSPITRLTPAMPRRYLLVAGCWALCIIALTGVWYRSHEIKDPGVFHWSVNLPRNNLTFQEVEIPPRSVELLSYDLGATGIWQESDGSQWTLYFFRWLPRSIHSAILSRIHRPDRCLPAAGMQQVADAGIKYFAAGNLNLPFRRYTYEADGKTMHVFFCEWEDGSEKQMGLLGSTQTDRLRSVLVGRRRVGNQSLELLISGYASLEEADRAVEQRLPEMIRRDDQPPTP